MSSEQELPDYYNPGAVLSLSLGPNNGLLNARVIQACTPFTMSQVILVEHGWTQNEKDNSTAHSRRLPKTFLAKIYDPKFFAHRLARGQRPARPWSLEAEIKAAAARCKSWDPDFEPWRHPENEDLPGWEEWYFQNSEKRYHAEAAAYKYLQAFQGSAIPRCYGTGSLQLPGRVISPHVLFLEFLPNAESLTLVDPKVVPLSLLQPLLDAVDGFGTFGVVHTDLNPGNILFSPGYQPTRATIIDFGEAGVREEEDEFKWAEIVEECGDSIWLRKRLQRAFGIDLSTTQPSVVHSLDIPASEKTSELRWDVS